MTKKIIRKLGIANRGEVAVRIHLAARELGIQTVLLHSEVDTNSKAYRTCDETVCIGGSSVSESYLNMENVIAGALSKGCEAIHPGFGFLSENADFAQKCLDQGLIFVGPSAEAIRLMGDKISARHLAIKAGVPIVPGYDGDDQSKERLLKEAEQIGFPVIIKASGGGGGRGLKISRSKEDFLDQLSSAQRESQSAFGESHVFIEKYLDHAKHIEFQIFGDASGEVFHLYDRECSVQRRHQKIIEEAISPALSEDLRNQMGNSAIQIAKEVQYKNAGTVEFILQDGQYYFMEMNTRLQVEHPVTENVMGMDLVKAQLLCAQGFETQWEQVKLRPQGHSIECRLYAEDPYQNGIPSTGLIGSCFFPEGPGRRFEVGFEKGDTITAYYDSMIAKIIVFEEDRKKCIQKMIQVLKETIIMGLQTNIPYLIEILNHPEFQSGEMTTQFISKNFPEGLSKSSSSEAGTSSDPSSDLSPDLSPDLSKEEKAFGDYVVSLVEAERFKSTKTEIGGGSSSPWQNYWRGL